METKEFSLKPEKQKKRGNWKGKLAAALAGVLGASVIGPAVASIMPETVEAGNGSSPTQSVKTWAEFKAAVEQGGTVYIGADIVVEETLNIDKTVRLYSDSTSNQYKIVRLYNTKTYNNGTLESDIRADFKGTIFNVSGNGNLIINENIILSGDKGTKNVKKTSSNSVCTEDSQYGFKLTALASSDIASDVPQKRAANSSDYEVELANYVFKVGDDAFWAVGGESGNYNLGTYTSWDITKHNNRNTYKPRATWSLIGSYYSSGKLNYYYLKNTETGQILYYNTNSGNLGYGITSSKPTETYRRWKSPIINFNDGNKLQYKAADNKGDMVIRGLYRIDRDYSSCLNGSGAGTQTSIDNDIESYAWRSSEINSNIGYFIDQNAGSVTIDGATIKDLTINDTSVKNVAPIYVSGGTFTMDSGDIVNNSVGYLDEQYNDWFSGQTANRILEITNTKLPRTETAGAIIFAGGEGHNINGGNIFGNRADTGAIVIKTPKDGNGGEKTKVTFGADEDETKKPIIGGNIGIHYAGAVYINPGDDADSASFIMKGGEIKDNFTWYKGGAIFASCEEDGYGHGTKRNAVAQFMMDGGLIDNNTAVHRGGAIEVMSDQVYLKKGKITNNNSRVLGGAIYIEGDRADRTYTLYIPDVYITENHAWTETKTGKEDNDYAYLKRKLLYDAGAVLENGNYTYNNPLGNVRSNNNGTSLNRGSENSVYEGPDSSDKKGKKAWTEDPKTTEARRWDLADGKTSDYKDYGGYSGHGGGIWTCSLGGYASVNFLDKGSSGAIVKNNYTNLSTPNDITAHSKDGGFILSDSDLDNHDPSEYIATNKGNIALNWNTLYSGGDYDIKNGTDISATPPENYGGVIISKNNARNGGAIAANGKLILGKANDVYEHRAEVEFEKTWNADTGVSNSNKVAVAFQAYINGKPVPGYQFVLDGTADSENNKEMLLNVYESSYYKAKISLPYGLDGTPTFTFDAAGQEGVSTLDNIWDFGNTGNVTGDIKEWNFDIKEIPVGSKTLNVSNGNYLLVKKTNGIIKIESTDRDYNFKDANGNYFTPTVLANNTDIQSAIGSTDSVIITGFGANNTDLYFVKSVTVSNGSITFNDLLNGDYTLVPYTASADGKTWTCGSNKTDFTINETETKYATSAMQQPDKVSLSYTEVSNDPYGYASVFGDDSKFTTHTTTATAYNSGNNSAGTSLSNSKRTEPAVEKYINKKVDETLSNYSEGFTYDILARVPDQAEEFVVSDTLVDWISFDGTADNISIRVLNDNNHKGDGTGTVAAGNGDAAVNEGLTTEIREKAVKSITNKYLSVKVNDKNLLNSLAGKWVQVTFNAKINPDKYSDVTTKVSERTVTHGTVNGTHTIENFDTTYSYRLYKIGNGLVSMNGNASNYFSDELIKRLGIQADAKVSRTNKLGQETYNNFDSTTSTLSNLAEGLYVVVCTEKDNDDKSKIILDRCEIFEIDGKENINWVKVAGDVTTEPFQNDSPYYAEDGSKQQKEKQVITGDTDDPADDPLHDGIGNRAGYSVTYIGGRQQRLRTNTVTVEPPSDNLQVEKYVNKRVDQTLDGFDSTFTYDIMAYIPSGSTSITINDELTDWIKINGEVTNEAPTDITVEATVDETNPPKGFSIYRIGNESVYAASNTDGYRERLDGGIYSGDELSGTAFESGKHYAKIISDKNANNEFDKYKFTVNSNKIADLTSYNLPSGKYIVVYNEGGQAQKDGQKAGEFEVNRENAEMFRIVDENNHLGNGSGSVVTATTAKTLDTSLVTLNTETNIVTAEIPVTSEDWGKWVQLTFNAQIKSDKYADVLEKLTEKANSTSEPKKATVSYIDQTGEFTIDNFDTSGTRYYRLYRAGGNIGGIFNYGNEHNQPNWIITNDGNVPASVRTAFGLDNWEDSSRTYEFSKESTKSTVYGPCNHSNVINGFDPATGKFTGLPYGTYFLYCFEESGAGGSEGSAPVLSECRLFEIGFDDRNSFNWVNVAGAEKDYPFSTDKDVITDESFHDGIGNRAGYTVSYPEGGKSLKTNVVTVEPVTTGMEITKKWDGSGFPLADDENKSKVIEAFKKALVLEVDGEDVPDDLQALFKERLTIEGTDTDTWKIKVTLPKYQGKSNYTIREDFGLILNDENIEQDIKDLLTGFTAKYATTLKDGKYKPDLDTENYKYRLYRLSDTGYEWTSINTTAGNTNIPENLYLMLHINKDTNVRGTVVIPDKTPTNYNANDKSFTDLTNGKYFLYCWEKNGNESNPVLERCEVFEIVGTDDRIIKSSNNAAGNGDIIYNTKKFEVKLKKVSSTSPSTGLTGASFSITKVKNASGEDVADAQAQNFETYGETFVKSDLEPGIYRIHETKAPTGYNYLKGDFQVKINNDGSVELESVTDGDTVTYDAEGIQFVVQNRPIELYKKLHVRKNWQNVDASEYNKNTVEIQIQSDYANADEFTTVNTITLSKDDNWKKDVTTDSEGNKLPLYNGTRVVKYKIVETKVTDNNGNDVTKNYTKHVEENDPFATYVVSAKTYTTKSLSVGSNQKALTLKNNSRNLEMRAVSPNDTLNTAKANKQAWQANVVSGQTLLRLADTNTYYRYLTYAYNGNGGFNLHATYVEKADEGGYVYKDYTTKPGDTKRYAGWTYSNGKLSQYNPYNGTTYIYTAYFTTTEGNAISKSGVTETDKKTLAGKTSSSNATTVKLQKWNGSSWVDATSLQNNEYYRIITGNAVEVITENEHSPKTYELDNTNPKNTVYSLFGKDDVDLSKSYSEKVISSASDLDTYTTGKSGCMGSSNLFGVLKNILYYGYSNDAENLKETYTLSDDDLKYLTAYAITEYTKHYTDGYTDKVDHSYGLTGPEASRVPDSGNLRAAYKKLMTLVSNTDKNLLNGVDLKLYYTGDDTDKVLLSADITSEQTAVVNSKDEMITLKGKKTWDDNSNTLGARPNKITLELWSNRNDENEVSTKEKEFTVGLSGEVSSDDVTVTVNGDIWEFTLGDYPKYVTMGNGIKRELIYEIREVNGGQNYTLFGDIHKTTVLGTSTNFEAAYGYKESNLFRSTWANSKYYLANSENEKINAYCLNLDKANPEKSGSSYSDGVHYTKVHIAKASDFASNNITFGTGATEGKPFKYFGHETEANLIKRLIKIQYYGYPNDKGELIDEFGLSSDQFIYLTQYAVWEYTNWYGEVEYEKKKFDFSEDKVNDSFGLSGNTGLNLSYDVYANEVGSNSKYVSNTTKEKLRNAYKKLMEMIESDQYTVPETLQLYVYKPTNGNSYQALIGIEVLELGELSFDLTNKIVDEVELPNTGGSGTLWIFLTGAGAVAAAITGLVIRSRRKGKIDQDVA